ADTRKLIWRLSALDALQPDDLQRAYAMAGGHPRTLEYLDALLRGGEAAFPDVADRLEAALERRGIPDPGQWLGTMKDDLDRALAETITLAPDDVLLDPLLTTLDGAPPAPEPIARLAVYRPRPAAPRTRARRRRPPPPPPPPPPAPPPPRPPPRGWGGRSPAPGGGAPGPGAAPRAPPPPPRGQSRRDAAEFARPPVGLTGPAQ